MTSGKKKKKKMRPGKCDFVFWRVTLGISGREVVEKRWSAPWGVFDLGGAPMGGSETYGVPAVATPGFKLAIL